MLWETGRPKASSDPPKAPACRSWRCVLMTDSVRREYYQAASGSRSNWLCQTTFVHLLSPYPDPPGRHEVSPPSGPCSVSGVRPAPLARRRRRNHHRGKVGLMGDALLTRASLLARLGDPEDRGAWQQFVQLYGSLVYGYARGRGLQDADAADLTQEVFLAVAQAAGRWEYDPQQGSFRGWLYGITRHKLAKFLQRRYAEPVGSGDTSAQQRLDQQPQPGPDPEAAWEQEFQQQVFRLAAAQIRDSFAPTTWQAFWR